MELQPTRVDARRHRIGRRGLAVATGGAGSSLLGTTSTAGSAIADAALTSLAAQASITLINNGGDIGKTLQNLGSSDTIKAAVAAQR